MVSWYRLCLLLIKMSGGKALVHTEKWSALFLSLNCLALGLVHLSPFHHADFCKKFITQEPSRALELFALFTEKVQAKPTQGILQALWTLDEDCQELRYLHPFN